MTKKWLFILLVFLVLAAAYLLFQQFQSLQLQVVDRPLRSEDITDADDCRKLSQTDANNCLLRLAIENGDASLCDAITKNSLIKDCQREVQFAQ